LGSRMRAKTHGEMQSPRVGTVVHGWGWKNVIAKPTTVGQGWWWGIDGYYLIRGKCFPVPRKGWKKATKKEAGARNDAEGGQTLSVCLGGPREKNNCPGGGL